MSASTNRPPMRAREIARLLGERSSDLVELLLPGGHREGHEWRCGSVAGEPGHSLGVHLIGGKTGVWSDFSTGQAGDALDLVRVALGLETVDAIRWARNWLRLDDGETALPARPASRQALAGPVADRDRWRYPWQAAQPIAGTLAELYLAGRGLRFNDPEGRVLRFAARRGRQSPDERLEYHPALIALLRDVRTAEPCGITNVYLQRNGSDRLRDKKGKTSTGRAKCAAVMLSAFDDPTYGLTVCEGVETGTALLADDLAPVWCCGSAGNIKNFPLLGGIEALTICADADAPGQRAAAAVAARWSAAGHQVAIVTPRQNGDWADARRPAS